MSVPQPPLGLSGGSARRLVGTVALAAALVAAICLAPDRDRLSAADPPTTTSGTAKEPLFGGRPLFADWPKGQTPDAVIILTGQTWGYLQPCGCSRPQFGGLERRAVFIDQLKKKGWPVAGVDLGDVYPDKPVLSEQGLLKYVATMNALREMGYLGVGIGKTELQNDPIAILYEYSFQGKQERRPFVLSANMGVITDGKLVSREKSLPIPPGHVRPVVDQIEVGEVGKVPVGVAGVASGTLRDENLNNKWASSIGFTNGKKAIEDARDALLKHKLKPQVNVLIFQGSMLDAMKVAADFPQFQVILCQSDDLPPMVPPVVNGKNGEKTLIVQTGNKGQHVGVLGVFKKPSGGFDLKYQLVHLGEEYNTPGTEAEALQNNKALQALDSYSKAVKNAKLLPKYPRTPHGAQIQAASFKPPVNNLSYVGSDACKACHAAEFKKWTDTHHSHAMDTLEKVAKRPSLRNFDGECVRCHTVGFEYKTGYIDDAKTPQLRHVGCESCHGPGSGHVDAPKDKDLLKLMSPWQQIGAPAGAAPAKLPDIAFMEKMAKIDPRERGKEKIKVADKLIMDAVSKTCMKCHDHEADPNFDLYKNWPQISHSGLAPPGGWPAVVPKPAAPPMK